MKSNKSLATIFLIVLIILTGLSIIMMGSLSFPRSLKDSKNTYSYLVKHIIWFGIGWFMFFITSRINYKKYKKIKGIIYVIGLILLIAVLIFGKEVNGARRWFSVGGFGIQPSEFAKIALIITMAGIIDLYRRRDKLETLEFFSFISVPLFIYVGLVIAEKSFSSTAQILIIGLALIFVSGARLNYFFTLIFFVGGLGVISVLKTPYRLQRILGHFGQEGEVYQAKQSLIAIGSGQLFGKFYGNGIQKYFYLPEIHTDYIFSGYAEETGFLGAIFLIGLYIILLLIIFSVIIRVKDMYAKYLLVGIFVMLAGQVVGNLAVVLQIMPSTGIPLPLMSYGGSTTIIMMITFGIVYNIIRKLCRQERKELL